MDNNNNNYTTVPNVMPNGMLHSVEDMDLIMAQIKHDGEAQETQKFDVTKDNDKEV